MQTVHKNKNEKSNNKGTNPISVIIYIRGVS